MLTGRKIRAITGYSHSQQLANAALWYNDALSFHDAAIVLHEALGRITGGIRIFAFNAAISLELIMKAILVAKNNVVPPSTHNLKELSEVAKVWLESDQMHTLDLLSEIIIWRGRYPAPKREEAWDDFHDRVLEQHKVRSKSGNVYAVMKNEKTFPTKENYEKIWSACLATYSHES